MAAVLVRKKSLVKSRNLSVLSIFFINRRVKNPLDFSTKKIFFIFRCNTDIELGVRCGFQTLLVLSGVTSSKDLEKLRSEKVPPLPDVVLSKLGDLLHLIDQHSIM